MSDTNSTQLAKLQTLNLTLRMQLELAEFRVPPLNDQIRQLGNIALLADTALLGLVIYHGSYSDFTGPHDSGPVLQSALLVPRGLGVIYWDSEEYCEFCQNPHEGSGDLAIKFLPFEECPSAIKALLLPQIDPLMQRLLERVASSIH